MKMNLQLSFFLAVACIACALWNLADGMFLEEVATERLRPGTLYGSRDGIPGTVRLSLQELSEHAQLGPRSNFRYSNGDVHQSVRGVKQVRLTQTFGGYDVMGSSVLAEMDLEERLSGHMYGVAVKNLHKYIPDPEACKHDVKKLLDLAIRLKGLNPNDPNIDKKDGRRIIYASPDTTQATLAYKVQFFYKTHNTIKYPVYILDACTHDVIDTYDNVKSFMPITNSTIHRRHPAHYTKEGSPLTYVKAKGTAGCDVSAAGFGGNSKTGKVTYNTPPLCLPVTQNGVKCSMTGTYTKTIDNQESESTTKTEVVEFTCATGYSDEVNGAFGVANDAHYHGQWWGQMYKDKYQLSVLNYIPRVVVHFQRALENAYSDGTDTYYGDGADTFYPLIGLDIVAHELAHCITSKNSDLVYRGQSGGMNEAFSDITAAAVRGFKNGVNSLAWTIGEDSYKGSGALRYMDDPTKDGSSIRSVWRYRFGMGVHTSSGVFNHAFYTMVKELNIDMFEAYKSFLDANLKVWSNSPNFFSGSCGVVQAAYDNGIKWEDVRTSFRRVGIPLIFCRASALSSSIFIGETREEILVSKSRSPILKVDLDHTTAINATVVEVEAKDRSEVKLVVGQDDEMTRVVASGVNAVKLNMAKRQVYVQLMSTSKVDMPVKLHVRAI